MSLQTAERLILWNLRDSVSEDEFQRVVDLGHTVLMKIPGVEGMSFGIATHDAQYRYHARIRFRDLAAVADFDADSTHIAFVRDDFAPLLAGEMVITYAMQY